MDRKRLVILESPYRGNTAEYRAYARACMQDSLARGEAPLASHLLYPQILRDEIANERALGIAAGLAWAKVAEATVVYIDHGISAGMRQGIEHAEGSKRLVEYRNLLC